MNKTRDAARALLEERWFQERLKQLDTEARKLIIDQVEKAIHAEGEEVVRNRLQSGRAEMEQERRTNPKSRDPSLGELVTASLHGKSILSAMRDDPQEPEQWSERPQQDPEERARAALAQNDDLDLMTLTPFAMTPPRPR